MTEKEIQLFTASINFESHPLKNKRGIFATKYYSVVEYFILKNFHTNLFIVERLLALKKVIVGNNVHFVITEENKDYTIQSILNVRWKFWLRKYRYLLFCDIALILIDKTFIDKTFELISQYINNDKIYNIESCLFSKTTKDDIMQYDANKKKLLCQEIKIIVTANMSAGKSTLINALVGKIVSSMKMEATTKEILYIYDKSFEDGRISKWDGLLTFDAMENILLTSDIYNSTGKVYISTYFSSFVNTSSHRICLVDTPGVNSAIHLQHGELTKKALTEEQYDCLVYVLNACQLGTDEEICYLQYIADHIQKNNVIFVLNKIDALRSKEDSIELIIENIRKDLEGIGFTNPKICPISAYYALLIKKCLAGVQLSEDEQDAFEMFTKKFNRSEYDLSRYYLSLTDTVQKTDNKLVSAAVKCGLYGLETMLLEWRYSS